MQVELVDFMGSDLTVVNAARVSMDKHHDEWDDSDEGLVKYLATHDHWTPFSHPQIQLRETVPIFIARQRFKHQIGFTYNEVSRRYVDDTPEFFFPDVWRYRPESSIKQGSGGFHLNQAHWNKKYEEHIKNSEALYNEMIADRVAPEQARMVLPQSMFTSYYVTGSLYALARAYNQRIDGHAQVEIQELAKEWDSIIRPLYPKTWEVLTSD